MYTYNQPHRQSFDMRIIRILSQRSDRAQIRSFPELDQFEVFSCDADGGGAGGDVRAPDELAGETGKAGCGGEGPPGLGVLGECLGRGN